MRSVIVLTALNYFTHPFKFTMKVLLPEFWVIQCGETEFEIGCKHSVREFAFRKSDFGKLAFRSLLLESFKKSCFERTSGEPAFREHAFGESAFGELSNNYRQKPLFFHENKKHRKNCKCCPLHSLFNGHIVSVNTVLLNCQKCNLCLKCPISGQKSLGYLF